MLLRLAILRQASFNTRWTCEYRPFSNHITGRSFFEPCPFTVFPVFLVSFLSPNSCRILYFICSHLNLFSCLLFSYSTSPIPICLHHIHDNTLPSILFLVMMYCCRDHNATLWVNRLNSRNILGRPHHNVLRIVIISSHPLGPPGSRRR